MQGPLDRMLQRMAGGTTPSHVADVLQGPDRRPRDRRGRRAGRRARCDAPRRHRYADARPRRRPPARQTRWGCEAARVKIAADRWHGELRHRAARAASEGRRATTSSSARATPSGPQAAAAELGVEGATNADAARAADLVVLATKADGAVETARELRGAIGTTPVLSVAAELRFTQEGVLPDAGADVDRRADPGRSSTARSSRGCTRSPPRTSAAIEAPDEDTLVCGDDADAKARCSSSRGKITSGPGDRCGPARERACARRHDGGDREREQALQGARRPPRHRPPLTRRGLRVIPLCGHRRSCERRGRSRGAARRRVRARAGGLEAGDVVVVAQKAVSKVEGRVVGLDDVEPSARARRARRRRRRSAAGRGDPARVGRDRARPARRS